MDQKDFPFLSGGSMPAFAASHLSQDERREIERAVERGSAAYIASRLAKIPAFDGRYFSFRGAFALHRKTWAKDVYKIPLNLL